MAKLEKQKQKILFLMQLLLERTDEEHPVTMAEIIDYLALHGITAERKSIYRDLEVLEEFGLDLITIRERPGGY